MQKIKIAVRFLHIFSVYYMQIVILCMQLNFVIAQGHIEHDLKATPQFLLYLLTNYNKTLQNSPDFVILYQKGGLPL